MHRVKHQMSGYMKTVSRVFISNESLRLLLTFDLIIYHGKSKFFLSKFCFAVQQKDPVSASTRMTSDDQGMSMISIRISSKIHDVIKIQTLLF